MSKDKIYVVTMYRWGERENHSYVLGAYTKKALAISEADKEEQNRGAKYIAEILEYNPNETDPEKAKEIRSLLRKED
jgi:hypothetical protein